jgi:hypothetical protein
MYLAGIIPGPKEPNTTQLNYYLRPLIDDLEQSWVRGVRYSRTALHPSGKLTRSALACVVCDLPAARKSAGFADHGSHHLCTVCDSYHMTNAHNVDYEKWKRRDKDEMRLLAEQWRLASSQHERELLFQKNGVRWSEFWRLPYWDPARQVVVDSMHCILEGLTQHFFRNDLGLKERKNSPKGKGKGKEKANPPPKLSFVPAYEYKFTQPEPEIECLGHKLSQKEVNHVFLIHETLLTPIGMNEKEPYKKFIKDVEKRNMNAIRFVCKDLGLDERSRKKTGRVCKIDLADLLQEWVCGI